MGIFVPIFPFYDIFRNALYPLGRAFEHSLSPAPLPQAGEGMCRPHAIVLSYATGLAPMRNFQRMISPRCSECSAVSVKEFWPTWRAKNCSRIDPSR